MDRGTLAGRERSLFTLSQRLHAKFLWEMLVPQIQFRFNRSDAAPARLSRLASSLPSAQDGAHQVDCVDNEAAKKAVREARRGESREIVLETRCLEGPLRPDPVAEAAVLPLDEVVVLRGVLRRRPVCEARAATWGHPAIHQRLYTPHPRTPDMRSTGGTVGIEEWGRGWGLQRGS